MKITDLKYNRRNVTTHGVLGLEKNLWIVDKEERNKIFDLSGNGYCFNDQSVDKAIEKVEKYLYLKNMDTFDAFKKWVDKNAKPRK